MRFTTFACMCQEDGKVSKLYVLAPILAALLDSAFQSGTLPDAVKSSLITPVFKKGDKFDPSNYRPIQGSTAPSEPPGAEPFAPAARRPAGGCPRDFGHLSKFGGGAAPSKVSSDWGQPPDF